MVWILLTFISALTFSLSKYIQKVLLKNQESDPLAFAFVFQAVVAVIFLIYSLVTGALKFPNLSGLTINLLLVCLLYSLGNAFTFQAFKLAEISEVSVLFASGTVWSVIAAVIILGESLTPRKVLGIIIVVAGLVAVNFRKSGWRINRGHIYALSGAMCFGLAFINDAIILKSFHYVSDYMILAFILPALTLLLFKPQLVKHARWFISKNIIPGLLSSAVFYSLSAITIYSAYKQGGSASVISPLQQTNIIFTVVLGYFFLRERDHLPNKIIGTLLSFIGVLLLV